MHNRSANESKSDARVEIKLNPGGAEREFLKAIRTLVLNAMHDRLTDDDANQDWVRQASSDPACSPEAIKKVLALRFGDKFAAFDPNDKEAGHNFVAQGGKLVYGPMLSGQEWANAKKAGAIEPAGKLCPTPKPYSNDPNAKGVDVVPEDQWTPASRTQFLKRMVQFADWSGLVIRLVYYPPYHSKYNPIERCWSSLEKKWNGVLLTGWEIIKACALRMTWRKRHPVVERLQRTYAPKVSVPKAEMKTYNARLDRLATLPKYDITIKPRKPRGR